MFWICFPFKGKEITGALKNKQANKQTKTMNIWGKVLCLRKIQKKLWYNDGKNCSEWTHVLHVIIIYPLAEHDMCRYEREFCVLKIRQKHHISLDDGSVINISIQETVKATKELLMFKKVKYVLNDCSKHLISFSLSCISLTGHQSIASGTTK